MCGIVGQVKRPGESPEPTDLAAMCAALEHRGPDARGLFTDDNVGLGIQRLRVVDLVTGDQPISNEDGSVTVVLNGEIYNFRELRAELASRGHRLATNGDTEVIVHLYEELGVRCVQRLHGMFAFALWDHRCGQLLLARDRVGKKPLLYSLHDGGISFASELGALIADRAVPRAVDPAAIDGYLTYGYVPTPRSILAAVAKLPPAHTLVFRDGRAKIERYWRLDYSRKLDATDLPELGERIREAIRDATRRRLVADVPIGAFLSGGIDSSAVVAAMSRIASGPVRTFSIGFDQAAYDELPYARQVAELYGTEHHEFVVRPDAIALAPKLVRHYGEPFADASAIPSFYLAEVTRRHVTVALNGDGGDESFGGYTRYVSNRLAARLGAIPRPLRRAVASVADGAQRGDITSVVNRARRLGRSLALEPVERYARYVSYFDEAQRTALYSAQFRADLGEPATSAVIAEPWRASSATDIVDVMLDVDTTTYLPDDLIAKIDIATMAHGLEARSPLLDHELMQFAASIPAGLKVRGRQKKWILREALREWLPPEILDRPKQGFQVPIEHWLANELRDHVREVLLDPVSLTRGYFRADAVRSAIDRQAAGTYADASRVWALLMLELWHREFADHAARPAVAAGAARAA
jgi:asparagine synthase (glutamine-hydrolysing)